MNNFKPLLAEDCDMERLQFPLITSPKLDGFRATFQNGKLVTRSLKPFKNRALNEKFQCYADLDGEFIVGAPQDPLCFNNTSRVVTAFDAPIDELRFYVFDLVDTTLPFTERYKAAAGVVQETDNPMIWLVPHMIIQSRDDLLRLEEATVKDGYEGMMIRKPDGRYKYGRSTVSEGILLKLKRRKTGTAEIIGFEEQMYNSNTATTNALGYTERSSHQANLVPKGTLGALVVRDIETKVEFNVGTGFDNALRQEIWDHKTAWFGSLIEYEYLPVGVKDKPRHPVYKGRRSRLDLSQCKV